MEHKSWDAILTYMRERNDLFNFDTLDQILQMDDDGSHEFTAGIFETFCGEAESSIAKLEIARERSALREIGDLSDYLHGSAAIAGAIKVYNIAQKLKYLSFQRDEKNERFMTDEEALPRAEKLIDSFHEESKETISILRQLINTVYE